MADDKQKSGRVQPSSRVQASGRVQSSGRLATGNDEPGGTGLRYGIIGGTLVAVLAFVMMSRSGPETPPPGPPKPDQEVKVVKSDPDKTTEPQIGEITVIQGKVEEEPDEEEGSGPVVGKVVSKKLSPQELAILIEKKRKEFEEADAAPPKGTVQTLSEEVQARRAKAPFFQNLPPEEQEKHLTNIRTLKQEMAEHEDDPTAHIALIKAQEEARLWDHAIQTANKAFDRFPESLPIAMERGRINGAWGWRRHAEEGFDRALKLDPSNQGAQRAKDWLSKNQIYHPVYTESSYYTQGAGAQGSEGSGE